MAETRLVSDFRLGLSRQFYLNLAKSPGKGIGTHIRTLMMTTRIATLLHVRNSLCGLLQAGIMATLCVGGSLVAQDVAAVEAQLNAREKRADLFLDEMRALDYQIESTVDQLLEMLRTVGDSKDSRTKIVRLKEQTVEALRKNISTYQVKRQQMQQELQNPTLHLTPEEKRKAIAKFDARVEKRVQQLISLTASMPTHKDYDRYKVVDSDWNGSSFVVNEDYKQNRRLTAQSDAQRTRLLKGLNESINRLQTQIGLWEGQLARGTTDAQRLVLTEEIARNRELLKSRRAQVLEVGKTQETAVREVGSREAQNLDMILRKAVMTLQRDLNTLFQRYSAYITERSNINASKASLAALKNKK